MKQRSRIGSWIQGKAASLAYGLLRALPVDIASGLMGSLARWIGPHLKISKIAKANLRLAFPERDEADLARLIPEIWDNFGRVAGEFPHMDRFTHQGAQARIEIIGGHHIEALRTDGQGAIVFSGHIGNWEIAPLSASLLGVPLDLIYRAANNPHTEHLYRKTRTHTGGDLLPKGVKGAKMAVERLMQGRHLGMLVDQKMNDGIAVPFFGRMAMTAPALAQFALKYRIPIIPARVIRLKGARFRVEFFSPLDIAPTGDRHADILAIMTQVNALLERWIRDHPEQWLWLHKRWPQQKA